MKASLLLLSLSLSLLSSSFSLSRSHSKGENKIEILVGGHFSADVENTDKVLSTIAAFTADVNKSNSEVSFQSGQWSSMFRGDGLRTNGYVACATFFLTTGSSISSISYTPLILIAGNFSNVNGQSVGSIAKLFPTNGSALPLKASLNGAVFAMAKISQYTVLVGGSFTAILTEPAVGVKYLAQYDLYTDQWQWVGVPYLLGPPRYILFCTKTNLIWIFGYYSSIQLFCSSPECADMYVVIGMLNGDSVDFTANQGTSDNVFHNSSFLCTSRGRYGQYHPDLACKAAYTSFVMDFEACDGVAYMLMMTRGETVADSLCGEMEVCKVGYGVASLWAYNTTELAWDLVTFGFEDCRCNKLNPCGFLLNQLLYVNGSLAISGLRSLFLYDLQSHTCEPIWEGVDLWTSALSYSESGGFVNVFGWGNETGNTVSSFTETGSRVRRYHISSGVWIDLPPIPNPADGYALSISISSNSLVGSFDWNDWGGETNPENGCDGNDLGFFRVVIYFDRDIGGLTLRQQYGFFDPSCTNQTLTDTWIVHNSRFWNDGTVFSVSASSVASLSRSGSYSIEIAIAGSFNVIGNTTSSGLVLCSNKVCDTWTPLFSSPTESNESMILIPAPNQLGIQSALFEGDELYVGGQFIWSDKEADELSKCNVGRYTYQTGEWDPLGTFGGGYRDVVSAIFDMSTYCRKLYVCGHFRVNATCSNGTIVKTKWVAVYNIDTDTWEAVGPDGAGFVVDTMISLLSIAADERYIYVGGSSQSGYPSMYVWDTLSPQSDWMPMYYSDSAFFTGTIHDIEIALSPNILENDTACGNVTQQCRLGKFCPSSVIYVGGSFSTPTMSNFAQCDDSPVCSSSYCCHSVGGASPDNTVRTIKIYGNYTFIGGSFTRIAQLFAPGVAVWTGFEWDDLPGLQNFKGTILSISVIPYVDPESHDPLPISFFAMSMIAIFLVLIMAVIAVVWARRKFAENERRKFYENLEIGEDGTRPELSLSSVLSGKLPIIPYNDLEIGQRIGTGAAGEVYKARMKKKKKMIDVAIKMLHFYNTTMDNSKFLDDFLFEIVLVSRLKHPNIVTFIGVSVDAVSNDLVLITELMPRGSLASILETRRNTLPLDLKVRCAQDIAEGMKYLHSFEKPIIHRDIKPANVLVADDWTCKLADLGVSTFKRQREKTMTTVGSPIYMAPEIIATRKYTEIADCYSYAVLLCDLFGPASPFSEEEFSSYASAPQLMFAVVEEQLRPNIPNECPPIIQAIISECFSADPSFRPTSVEICMRLLRASVDLQPV